MSKSEENGSPGDGCEARGSGEMDVALISGATFTHKSVTYYDVNGVAIIEGDIALGTVPQVKARTKAAREAVAAGVAFGVGIPGAQFRWPNCTMPYEIDSALPSQERVTDAIAHWEANTAFRFPIRTAANAGQYPDYVRFTDAGGCWSLLGRQGGMQEISLGAGCSTGNAIHEIGHAVGLWHEQSREDRDLFVTINWQNIQTGMAAQFNQHIADGDDLGAYDYGSIMHYPRTAFSKNGQETITPVTAGAVIGQRAGLSEGDIAAVLAMYPDGVAASDETKWVTALYADVLGRAPDAPGLAHWVARRQAGATLDDISNGFLNSVEYTGTVVRGLYRKFLDREPDPGGHQHWMTRLQQGAALQDVATGFCDSAEYKTNNPAPTHFVESLYSRLLGRVSDAGGKQGWVGALQSGRTTTFVIDGFLRSDEYATQRVVELYQGLLGRQPDPAGLAAWVKLLTMGVSFQRIQRGFLASNEYRARALTRF